MIRNSLYDERKFFTNFVLVFVEFKNVENILDMFFTRNFFDEFVVMGPVLGQADQQVDPFIDNVGFVFTFINSP